MKHSPRSFYESIRPEKFSDSVVVSKGKLNRSILEYYLDTITNRNQERDFETFAIKLLELEICPNLRSQTGPVGGGDGKVDSENIPTSEFTDMNSWEGVANESGDRWAFAVSAKKDWVTKVKSDVQSAMSTGRSYKRVFFITNQFAKDKKRAELEDTLSTANNVGVTILDRNWILDRVFRNGRQKLVIAELRLDEGLEDEVSIGPSDYKRIQLFETLNQEIEQAISKREINHKVIKDSLETAILARGMGKSRTDVDGLFERALRLAKQMGSADLIYSIIYHKAWTTYFWFEDFDAFVEMYDTLENFASQSTNIYTLEMQHNLWQILRVLSSTGYSLEAGFLDAKAEKLKILLTSITLDETRPTASLQGKNLFDFG